jgi:hypothetical protein
MSEIAFDIANVLQQAQSDSRGAQRAEARAPLLFAHFTSLPFIPRA